MHNPLSILMLRPRQHIHSPVPKHTPLLIEGLRHLGHRVDTLEWGRTSDGEGILGKLISRSRDLWQVRSRLRAGSYDVLVVKTSHDWFTLLRDIPLMILTRSTVKSTILQFHGSEPERLAASRGQAFKAATRLLISRISGALVLSSEEQGLWEEVFPSAQFEVVRNPMVPFERSSSPDTTFQRSEPMVLFVGRLLEAKGILDLIRALPNVLARTACHLLVLGEGPDRSEAERMTQEMGITPHVTFAGYLEGDQLIGAYEAADVFVLPTSWPEGFPTVIAEAMQAGLPVVTTQGRGQADYLAEGRNGLFVPYHDPEKIAESLIRLLTNDDLRISMGEENREQVKMFSSEAVARDYEDALRRVMHA